MIYRYIFTLLITWVVACICLTFLPFATNARVRSGTSVEETFVKTFTIENDIGLPYRDERFVNEALKRGVVFVGSGVVRVQSAQVQIEPKEVSWTEPGAIWGTSVSCRAPGAKMTARITWSTAADAENGASGAVRVGLPPAVWLAYESRRMPIRFHFRSGGHTAAAHSCPVREVQAFRSTTALWLSRLIFALPLGLAIAVLPHSAWWYFHIEKEKKSRLAALGPADPMALPRTFYGSPTYEWETWTACVLFAACLLVLAVSSVIYNGFADLGILYFCGVILSAGAVCGLLGAAWRRYTVMTVRLDADTVSIAKGRGKPRWITARWSELSPPVVKTKKPKKTNDDQPPEWIELTYPDGTTRKIHQEINEYDSLKRLVFILYNQQKQLV